MSELYAPDNRHFKPLETTEPKSTYHKDFNRWLSLVEEAYNSGLTTRREIEIYLISRGYSDTED